MENISPALQAIGTVFFVIIMNWYNQRKNGQKLTAKTDQWQETIDNLNEQIDGLKTKVETAEQARDKAHESAGRLETELRSEIKRLQFQIDELKEKNNQAVADTIKANQEKETARAEQLKALAKYTEAQETIIGMVNEMNTLEKDIAQMKIKIEAMETVEQIVHGLTAGIGNAIREALSTSELQKMVVAKVHPVEGG